jgi:hypothetical protein
MLNKTIAPTKQNIDDILSRPGKLGGPERKALRAYLLSTRGAGNSPLSDGVQTRVDSIRDRFEGRLPVCHSRLFHGCTLGEAIGLLSSERPLGGIQQSELVAIVLSSKTAGHAATVLTSSRRLTAEQQDNLVAVVVGEKSVGLAASVLCSERVLATQQQAELVATVIAGRSARYARDLLKTKREITAEQRLELEEIEGLPVLLPSIGTASVVEPADEGEGVRLPELKAVAFTPSDGAGTDSSLATPRLGAAASVVSLQDQATALLELLTNNQSFMDYVDRSRGDTAAKDLLRELREVPEDENRLEKLMKIANRIDKIMVEVLHGNGTKLDSLIQFAGRLGIC